MHECPNCGYNIEDISVEVCPSCDFDFNTTLSCPYKVSNKCVHNRVDCSIYGLNYELCKMYLHKSGIMN